MKVALGCASVFAAFSRNCALDDRCKSTLSPVCGDDGLSYMNDCIAEGQGIKVTSRGPCKGCMLFDEPEGGDLRKSEEAAAALPPVVTKADLTRFAAEGFTFQTFARVAKYREISLPGRSELPRANGGGEESLLVRVSEGRLYGQARHKQKKRDGSHTRESYVPSARDKSTTDEKKSRRELIIFDKDRRYTTKDVETFPYNTIGILWIHDIAGQRTRSWCSAALVAPRTVLTAGHCVYDTYFRSYFPGWVFVPGASGTEHASPYGNVSAKAGSATVFTRYINGDNNWDMAILTLEEPIGEQIGWMGVTGDCPQKEKLYTTGYPGDLSIKVETSGGRTRRYPVQYHEACEGWNRSCVKHSAHYNIEISACDIYGGQSGSPLYNPQKIITAVCSFEYLFKSQQEHQATRLYPADYNGFNVVTQYKYDVLTPLFV